MNNHILLVDDDDAILSFMETHLKTMGYRTRAEADAKGMRKAFQEDDYDLVLLDFNLPDGDGLALIKEIHEQNPDLPIIMITASGTVNLAVEAMRSGAYDFCPKPVDLNRIKVSVKNAIERYQLKKQVSNYQRVHKNSLCGMIGGSPRMQVVYRMIELVAPTIAPVLITGESGTGKELVTKAIHQLSPRCEKELIDLNCAAIPKDLLENELFGHEPNAFTGAKDRYIGHCERADGSTLFLDEIAEMDMQLQSKMLRFLQDYSLYRVGGKERITVDVRIVAATNKNPLEAIQSGGFREDLYYRLNVVNIPVPALRERPEDIPDLAELFLSKYTKEMERPCREFSDEAMDLLCAYPWPGNVRELENMIRQMVVLQPSEVLDAGMVPEQVKKGAGNPTGLIRDLRKSDDGIETGSNGITPLDVLERKAIEHALEHTKGNVARASTALNVSQATLYRKLKDYGLVLDQFK